MGKTHAIVLDYVVAIFMWDHIKGRQLPYHGIYVKGYPEWQGVKGNTVQNC